MQTELELRDKEAGEGADAMREQIKAANRSRRSYGDFLRRFCVTREEVHLDPDEFDLNFYTYGLSVYGNLPLIEPLETPGEQEDRRAGPRHRHQLLHLGGAGAGLSGRDVYSAGRAGRISSIG